MATSWQSNPSFTAGAICRAADLNTLSSNMLLVGKVPMALVYWGSTATVQSLNHDTDTAIVFSTNQSTVEAIDRADPADSSGMHNTSTNTARITPTVAGWYLVSGSIPYATNNVGVREARIYKNGGWANPGSLGRCVALSNKGTVATVGPILFSLNGNGDYVELYGYQDSGGALSTVAGTTLAPYFQAIWISPL